MQNAFPPLNGDLVIARSQEVDDDCGWTVLLSRVPVLYCTDAELVLSAEQNRDIQRFREALYLYLTGQDSQSLDRAITGPNSRAELYQLGYWAPAASLSLEERREGIREIETELIPQLDRVATHDEAVGTFFRQFQRIVVIDHVAAPTFKFERLASLLAIEREQTSGDFKLIFCTSR